MNDIMWPGKDDPLVIIVGIQHDGAAYQLLPPSQRRIEEAYPKLELLRSVFLGHDKEADFERLQPPRWEQMATLLTGLNAKQLMRLGGVRIYSPERDQVLWEWLPTPRASRA
jgi:hypothetical protein